MKILKILVFLLSVLFLSSCATVYVQEYSKAPGFNINGQRDKSSTVTGFEPVIIKEFVKTFAKRYPQAQHFSTEYAVKVKDRLARDKIFAAVVYDSSVEWKSTRQGSFAKSDLNAIDSLFNSCQSDYIITISDFEVSNRIVTSYSGGGPNNMGSQTSTEYCLIDARYTLYDVKTRKKLLEFTSRGEKSVFLFGFENALIKAIDNSIEHAMLYIKTSKKEFSD